MTERWTFTEPISGDTWMVPINPNSMTAPSFARNLTFAYGSKWGQERIRAIDKATQPREWSFSGVLLTKDHYDSLLEWSQKLALVRISDHLGRTFEVVITQFDPIERLPTPKRPWRVDYTITCMLLKEITA
jgi:hypothetical protein